MPTQLITYEGQIRALCTPRRVFLAQVPESALNSDGPFVLAMCLYAGDILNHLHPGPYREADARAYARALLIPEEVLDRARGPCKVKALATWLGVPAGE